MAHDLVMTTLRVCHHGVMGQPESREQQGEPQSELPPGQRPQRGWPVTHYGPVPKFRPDRWEFRVFGATADGDKHCWNHEEFSALPFSTVLADLHCVTKFSMLRAEWGGVPARTVLGLAPPAPHVTHVMVWAEYGYQRQSAAGRLHRRPDALRHPQGRRTAHAPSTASRCASSCRICTPGRAPSGSAASST